MCRSKSRGNTSSKVTPSTPFLLPRHPKRNVCLSATQHEGKKENVSEPSTVKISLSTQYHLLTSRWCKHQSVNSTKYTTFRRWCVLSIESQEESTGGGGGDVTCMWGTPSEVSKDRFSWWKRVGKRKGAGEEQETEQADVTSEAVERLSSQEHQLCIPHRSFSVWIRGACALTCVWVSFW